MAKDKANNKEAEGVVAKDLRKIEKIVNEFKKFISRGNVMDLAVGVIIGGAFGKIVTSLVNDIIMPVIGVLLGGLSFTGLSLEIGNASIAYGNFIQNIVDFLIIAVFIFIFVKLLNGLNLKAATEQVADKKVAKNTDEQLEVLKQIRDQLKNTKN
jgi:large conductance mechanosensitive channel